MPKYVKIYETKIGNLAICSDDSCITNVFFDVKKVPEDFKENETKVIKQALREIEEYLNGERKEFTVALRLDGTEFQKKVWLALKDIPYGKTCSYKYVAQKIGCPNGCRAVGLSNSKNPILILIPCHRVINSNGSLGGFSGGLLIKEKLLDIEKIKID